MLLNIKRLMYNRLHNFLGMISVIYELQFGFRQIYSTSHPLIHLTDKVRKQIDSGHFACRILFHLLKAFDTVGHDILIQKLNYYGIRGVASNWFSSYIQDQLQNVRINVWNTIVKYFRNT